MRDGPREWGGRLSAGSWGELCTYFIFLLVFGRLISLLVTLSPGYNGSENAGYLCHKISQRQKITYENIAQQNLTQYYW